MWLLFLASCTIDTSLQKAHTPPAGCVPAAEQCNGVDDDCDGLVDDADPNVVGAPTWYADVDLDGWGNPDWSRASCVAPEGTVANAEDCADADEEVYPHAPEICNTKDDDCDSFIDEADPDVVGVPTWHRDRDSDAFGSPTDIIVACACPVGCVADDSDCDDSNRAVHPGATEVCNGVDDECDTLVDEADPDLTGAPTWHRDQDSDAFGSPTDIVVACTRPAGYIADGSDCDDADGAVHPGATEVCNGVDDECDTLVDEDDPDLTGAPTWHRDRDSDAFGSPTDTVIACARPAGYLADGTDCDDSDRAVNPRATEVCNGVDDECDTLVDEDDPDVTGAQTWHRDGDSDTFGSPTDTVFACACPAGYVADGTDCNDAAAAIHPGAAEVCNAIDDECDTLVDEADPGLVGAHTWHRDADGDALGWRFDTIVACACPAGYVADGSDCDDTDPAPVACDGGGDDDGTTCSALMGTDDGQVPSFDGSCDTTAGFTEYDGHCYFAVDRGDSWGDARATCIAAGGHLATVGSAEESDLIYSLTGRVWVGACDADVEGTWAWVTGEPWSYAPWASGEPNNMSGSEDCVEMYSGDSWNDIWCTYNSFGQGYVCEFGDAVADGGETDTPPTCALAALLNLPAAGTSQVALDSDNREIIAPAYDDGPYAQLFDADTFADRGTFPTGDRGDPVLVDTFADQIWVGNLDAGTITVVARSTHAPIATLTGFLHPSSIVQDPDAGTVYVGDADTGEVSAYDPFTLSANGSLALGAGLTQMTLGGGLLFVPHTDGTLDAIDAATLTIRASTLISSSLYGAVVAPETNRLFVSGFSAGEVYVMEASTLTVLGSVPIASPYQLALSADSATVAVPGYGDGTLNLLDVATGTLTASAPACTGATDVAQDAVNRYWVVTCATRGGLEVMGCR